MSHILVVVIVFAVVLVVCGLSWSHVAHIDEACYAAHSSSDHFVRGGAGGMWSFMESCRTHE